MQVARILPRPDARAPRYRPFTKHQSPDGRMERCSELTRPTAPAPHETCTTWKTVLRVEALRDGCHKLVGSRSRVVSKQLFAFA